MENLKNFFWSRFEAANDLFDSGRYDEAIQAYEELLFQPQLPWAIRIRSNANMYELVDDWQLKNSYYEAAEEAFAGFRRMNPVGSTDAFTELVVTDWRKLLDEIRQELSESRPSELAPARIVLRGLETKTERAASEEDGEAEVDSDEETSSPIPSKSLACDEPPGVAEQHGGNPTSQLTEPPSQEVSRQVDEAADHSMSIPVSAADEDDEEDEGGVTLPRLGLDTPAQKPDLNREASENRSPPTSPSYERGM